ncbi:hypothetical protein KIN20_014719 [Parelaphostrongylus tenuis]|uniref:Uncharacterized protein n=1 Tax=Parelaphostrongylus tenuis TaxID=148309 RepID=A0AAD5MHI3_PARTN|nr:hypothetical protein KIN20_014719 [Parelaphostrongylus tenuis]
MTVKGSTCFLIDSILEEGQTTNEKRRSFPPQRHLSPTSMAGSSTSLRKDEKELGSNRLTCVISSMIGRNHEDHTEASSRPHSHHLSQPQLFGQQNQMESVVETLRNIDAMCVTRHLAEATH